MSFVPLLPNLAAPTAEWIRVDTDAVRFGLASQLAFHPCPTRGRRSSAAACAAYRLTPAPFEDQTGTAAWPWCSRTAANSRRSPS